MQIFAMMQQVFELWTNIAGTYPRRIKVRFFLCIQQRSHRTLL